MSPSPSQKFIIRPFSGRTSPAIRELLTLKFPQRDADTWSFLGTWDELIERLDGQQFAAYASGDKWSIYLLSRRFFDPVR